MLLNNFPLFIGVIESFLDYMFLCSYNSSLKPPWSLSIVRLAKQN